MQSRTISLDLSHCSMYLSLFKPLTILKWTALRLFINHYTSLSRVFSSHHKLLHTLWRYAELFNFYL